MDELHRMLGREHEADLEREVLKHRRAAGIRARQDEHAENVHYKRPRRLQLTVERAIAFLNRRAARGEA